MENAEKKWNLIVDVARCENCNNCYMTILDEYVGNTFAGYSGPCPHHGHHWIQLHTRERGSGSLMDVAYLFTTCNQCDDAPCRQAARNGAVTKRADGIVIIDPVKAKGQRHLVDACPYGHIWWNEKEDIPQKWCWDAHLLDAGWKEPRPVSVCATGSLMAAKISDDQMTDLADKHGLEVLHPEFGTRPRIWYKNLYRYSGEHIAGSVAAVKNGIEDVVADAQVTLLKDDRPLDRCKTDFFGDFKFDALKPDSGEYTIRIQADGDTRVIGLCLSESVNLGVIRLSER
ncbi:BthL: pyrogallol hydroxytransferase small subunit [Desulfosarcina variabilis str. Montpellier]|uniref:4Fe-4S dicluster domain-containing protein n=1 Tax=Desulfosarcina variabilis TaxID=2300 RepID=UPI003AFB1BA8